MRTAFALAGGVFRALESGDHKVMLRVNRWPAPRWIRLWMVCATRCGDGWLWFAMGALVLALGGRERSAALLAAASATGVGIAVFLLLKRAIGRKRPCALMPHCWHTLPPPDQFSFPSGHTITAFAVTTALGSFYPELRTSLGFCAASVAVSRVLLGMHFVSDVIAGAVLGGGLASVCVWAAARLTGLA
jgi:undecaprenyl-diphosphatase